MSQFSGSLVGKRKADLIDLATALGLPDTDTTVAELRHNITTKLNDDSSTLRQDPTFSGLYSGRKRNQTSDESETPAPESKGRGRKSINKTLEKLVDAAGIPLPDSPISVSKIKSVALDAADQAREAADHTLALVDSDTHAMTAHIKRTFPAVVRFVDGRKVIVEGWVREVRDILSTSEGLIPAALAIEAAFLYKHVVNFNSLIVRFPPEGLDRGTFGSLLRTGFFWMPAVSWTFNYPRFDSSFFHGDLWAAFTWWFFATVLPPLALSTIISFVPQKGRRSGRTTRHQSANSPTPTVDVLTFVFIRLAVLLLPLTNACPTELVDALEASGNSQGRALAAGLLAALVLAERLTKA